MSYSDQTGEVHLLLEAKMILLPLSSSLLQQEMAWQQSKELNKC